MNMTKAQLNHDNEANDFIFHTLLAAVGIRKGSHRAPEAELLKFAGNAS